MQTTFPHLYKELGVFLAQCIESIEFAIWDVDAQVVVSVQLTMIMRSVICGSAYQPQ